MLGNFFLRLTEHKSNLCIRNESFPVRINKEYNVEIGTTTSSGGLRKFMKSLSFPWSLPGVVLSILNVRIFVENHFS